MTHGLFITFEGVDGSGKSTQAALLDAWLTSLGHTTVRTREPGGTDVGRLIRAIVLDHPGELAPRAEALLFAADRGHHIASKVRPALERGDVVIQDRYLDSSIAYQGAGRVLDATQIRDLSLWATDGLLPDVTILLDVDPVVALERAATARGAFDRIEEAGVDFQRRVRDSYLELAAAEPDRFTVLDASAPVGELAAAVRERIAPLLVPGHGDRGDVGGRG